MEKKEIAVEGKKDTILNGCLRMEEDTVTQSQLPWVRLKLRKSICPASEHGWNSIS